MIHETRQPIAILILIDRAKLVVLALQVTYYVLAIPVVGWQAYSFLENSGYLLLDELLDNRLDIRDE
jgi:hypothetical protein